MIEIQLQFPFMYDNSIYTKHMGVYKESCKHYHICITMILEPIPMCNVCRVYEHKRRDIDD